MIAERVREDRCLQKMWRAMDGLTQAHMDVLVAIS